MTVLEREPLTRQRIADAALLFIDDSGIGGLSMRKLGAVLGVEAMSLYNHVENKADLFRAVTSTLYAEVLDAYGEPDGDWKVHARALSHAYVDVAARHPKAILLLIDTPVDSVQELEFYSKIMAASRLMTADIHVAALAFSVVGNWVVGTLVGQYGLVPRPDGDESATAEPVPDGYEEVARFRGETDELRDAEKFDEGLETILAGVEARYLST